MASEYQLTIDDEDNWSLTLSDQGVSVPATHAGTHSSGGADPITIANTQVTGLGTMSTQAASSVAITGGTIGGLAVDLAVADGGTGASNQADARTNLGLGTMSTQPATSVTITGGSINGTTVGQSSAAAGAFTTLTASTSATLNSLTLTTDLSVANGGTGVSTLTGVAIGTGATAFTAASSSTVGQVLRCVGADTFAFGAVDLADTDAVTGTLPLTRGGTAATSASAARTSLDVPATNSTIRWRSDITAYTGGASNALDSIDISDTAIWPTGAGIAFSVSGNLVVYRLTTTGAGESSPNIILPDTAYASREWTLVPPVLSNVTITAGTINGTIIGATTPAAATFTTVAGTAGTFSSSVSVGTTLAVTGATTLTGLLTANGGITLGDGQNIAFSTATGTKIGTGATQKIGFWNATPAVQPALVADATGGAVIDIEARAALNDLLAKLRTIGIIAP